MKYEKLKVIFSNDKFNDYPNNVLCNVALFTPAISFVADWKALSKHCCLVVFLEGPSYNIVKFTPPYNYFIIKSSLPQSEMTHRPYHHTYDITHKDHERSVTNPKKGISTKTSNFLEICNIGIVAFRL